MGHIMGALLKMLINVINYASETWPLLQTA